jgi:hypothetical protein
MAPVGAYQWLAMPQAAGHNTASRRAHSAARGALT